MVVKGTLFEKCNLGLKYLSSKNGLSTNPDFETGIAKIQSGSEQGVQLLSKVFGVCMMHLIPRGAMVCLQSRLK
jgi:hypothetical protein